MPYVKNSTFTEYKFAFMLLHSAKLNFLKQNRNKMLNLIVLNDDFGPKTSCFIFKPTNHTKSTVCIDFYGKQNSWIFCK